MYSYQRRIRIGLPEHLSDHFKIV